MRKIFKTVEVLLVTTPPHACMPSDSFASRISAEPRNSPKLSGHAHRDEEG